MFASLSCAHDSPDHMFIIIPALLRGCIALESYGFSPALSPQVDSTVNMSKRTGENP